ncbi:MAG: hypothetical protein ACT4NY_14985 [Pseudonocardiales bacterium]
MMRPGVDDGGVLLLHHDGWSWVMLNLGGHPAYRNDDISAADTAGACDWAHDIATAIADTPPPRPRNTVAGVRCYTFHERDGVVQAELSAGRIHHDGQGWVLVNAHGDVTRRNETIPRGDDGAALGWANQVIAATSGTARHGKWRANIGRFPQGTYCDVQGRLGRQRLRRAWNQMLAWTGIT